jgi:hypothetical protein
LKNYLMKFQSAPVSKAESFGSASSSEPSKPSKPVTTFRNVPGEEPSKPSKPGFDGFDGSPDSTFPKVFPAGSGISPDHCPTCNSALLVEAGPGWRHGWCPEAGHFDQWHGFGAFTGGVARQQLDACLARHECPECHEPMTFRQREPEKYFCHRCRLWSIEGVLQ